MRMTAKSNDFFDELCAKNLIFVVSSRSALVLFQMLAENWNSVPVCTPSMEVITSHNVLGNLM